MDRDAINRTTGAIIGAAMKVHSTLGPGLLESAYRDFVIHELKKCGLAVQSEVGLPVVYDGVRIEAAYRVDMIVEGTIVIELKAVATLLPIHKAQLLSYLRLGGYPAGLLINFHVVRLKHGITRMVNDL